MIMSKEEITLIIITGAIVGTLLSLLIRIIREKISIKMYFIILLHLLAIFLFPIILIIHIIFNRKSFIENFIIKRIVNKEPKLKEKLDLKSEKEKQRIYSKFSFVLLRSIIKCNITKFDLIVDKYFSTIKVNNKSILTTNIADIILSLTQDYSFILKLSY